MGPAYTAPARMIAELNLSVQQLLWTPERAALPVVPMARQQGASGRPW